MYSIELYLGIALLFAGENPSCETADENKRLMQGHRASRHPCVYSAQSDPIKARRSQPYFPILFFFPPTL